VRSTAAASSRSIICSGFNDRLGPLIVVGVLYLAGSVVIMLVVAILAATIGRPGWGHCSAGDAMDAGWAALATVVRHPARLRRCPRALPLMMAYWFAPARHAPQRRAGPP
jgi:hypothetical protein